MCMQINYSMCLNCLLSTRALSRERSASVDAPMTRYSMLCKRLAGAFVKYHTDRASVIASNDGNAHVCRLMNE